MTTRTTRTVIRFQSPFVLPGLDEPQPPGDYQVDQDEELLEAGTRLAWRRTGAFIHLPAIGMRGAREQMLPVEPAILDEAIQMDRTPI
ncbi:hypothetical protein [Pararhizobium haloflavum]|uniref:hypothetical protein n=1 Tax=Pararhizobium haloflavum TaxID=2037914 RepID=UPI000C1982A3|nr:hypothetical protein [Pararhizobium haloflavum]